MTESPFWEDAATENLYRDLTLSREPDRAKTVTDLISDEKGIVFRTWKEMEQFQNKYQVFCVVRTRGADPQRDERDFIVAKVFKDLKKAEKFIKGTHLILWYTEKFQLAQPESKQEAEI